jgi:hypothetical protein
VLLHLLLVLLSQLGYIEVESVLHILSLWLVRELL